MTILDEIAAFTRLRVKEAKAKLPLSELKKITADLGPKEFAFKKALSRGGVSLICECKKASPSKGLISPDYPYLKIAKDYCAGGADAISVLTEPKWFLGKSEHLKEIALSVSAPCLRKDFTIDEYMIYEARALGADAVLLITSLLSSSQLKEYLGITHSLGLSALVESHGEDELRAAIESGAEIIGVNNRNLKDFSVDSSNSLKLRSLVPSGVLFVSESGVKGPDDIAKLKEFNVDAALVGETLMRSSGREAAVRALKEKA